MRKLTQDEELEILNGDDNYPKMMDIRYDLTKNEYKIYEEEVSRIYCKWRHMIFKDSGIGYYRPQKRDLKPLKKYAEFCYTNKLHPIQVLKLLHGKAIEGKANKEAFFLIHYIVNEGVLQSSLATLSKSVKIENSYSSNNQINIKNILSQKFDMSNYNDRAINSIVAVAKSLKLNHRVNCSDNIREMAQEIVPYV